MKQAGTCSRSCAFVLHGGLRRQHLQPPSRCCTARVTRPASGYDWRTVAVDGRPAPPSCAGAFGQKGPSPLRYRQAWVRARRPRAISAWISLAAILV